MLIKIKLYNWAGSACRNYCTVHWGAFCQSSFQWIYYYGRNKSTGKEIGKSHLFALLYTLLVHTGSTHLARFDLSYKSRNVCGVQCAFGSIRNMTLSIFFDPIQNRCVHRWSPCVCLNKIKIIGTMCNIGPSIISHASIRRTSSVAACCSNDEKKSFKNHHLSPA